MQNKVRSDLITEYWLRKICACPEKQLFDWGMMRLRRPPYGVGDAFAMEANNNMKKKRDAEVIFSFSYHYNYMSLVRISKITIMKLRI